MIRLRNLPFCRIEREEGVAVFWHVKGRGEVLKDIDRRPKSTPVRSLHSAFAIHIQWTVNCFVTQFFKQRFSSMGNLKIHFMNLSSLRISFTICFNDNNPSSTRFTVFPSFETKSTKVFPFCTARIVASFQSLYNHEILISPISGSSKFLEVVT